MNNYEFVYKTRAIISFASCNLGAKHITSRWVLLLRIQNNKFLLTPKLHCNSTDDEFHHNSKLENGWNFWTGHKTWHVVKHNTCVHMAPTSFANLTNWESLLQNPNKCKLGSSLLLFDIDFCLDFD